MPRTKLIRSDENSVGQEIARLRDLDLKGLRARWRGLFKGEAPAHLPGHLLLGLIVYQLQADTFGDLDLPMRRAIDGTSRTRSETSVEDRLATSDRQRQTAAAGTNLTREWNGRQHRVMAMADGYAWNGKTYKSLSQVAFAITGTKWNGPRFFGLRDAVLPTEKAKANR